MAKLITKQFTIDSIKEIDEEQGIIKAVISSGMPDRQGDMVDQTSWNFDEYMKNPVVLWAHDHSQPAIGKALSIGLNAEGMTEAVVQFAINEYEYAKTIFKLYAGKFMRAFSVGFSSGKEDVVNGIRILRDNILYEFSAVNVPADALALAKTKGIDVSFFEKKRGEKSPACRLADETKNECVLRKIPEIMDEDPGMTQEQAVAIAESLCDNECGKEKEIVEKEGRVLSSKNRDTIVKAKEALENVLAADSAKDEGKKDIIKEKLQYKKIVNKAIRELIEVRNK